MIVTYRPRMYLLCLIRGQNIQCIGLVFLKKCFMYLFISFYSCGQKLS